MLTSLDGGEGGGGTIPTGGLGPPPPFSYFWKCQSASFSIHLESYCLLYQLRIGAIWKYVMMHEQHHNSSWKLLSLHWFEDDNRN